MEILRAEHLTKQYGRKPNIVMPIMLDGKKPEEGFLEEIVRMLGLKDKSEGEPGIKKEGKRQAGGYSTFHFTLLPLEICTPILIFEAVLISWRCFGNLEKQSIVERLREA